MHCKQWLDYLFICFIKQEINNILKWMADIFKSNTTGDKNIRKVSWLYYTIQFIRNYTFILQYSGVTVYCLAMETIPDKHNRFSQSEKH